MQRSPFFTRAEVFVEMQQGQSSEERSGVLASIPTLSRLNSCPWWGGQGRLCWTSPLPQTQTGITKLRGLKCRFPRQKKPGKGGFSLAAVWGWQQPHLCSWADDAQPGDAAWHSSHSRGINTALFSPPSPHRQEALRAFHKLICIIMLANSYLE